MRYLPAILLMLSLMSCSEDEQEPAVGCEPENSSEILMEDSYVYSGDEVIIKGEFCLEHTIKVLIDDVGYNLTEKLPAQISFIMPERNEDSVSIKIQSDGTVLDFVKKIAVFPGNGSWREVAPFPGPGRGFSKYTSVGNTGYLISGSNYLGHTEELGYSYDYYTDLYQYSEPNNTWTLVESHDDFARMGYITGDDQSLYLFPSSIFSSISSYELNTGNFGTISSIGSRGSFYPFFEDGELFHFVIENNTILTLKKYSSPNNEWQALSTFDIGISANEYANLNFAFVQQGVAYVGYNIVNSSELVMLAANMEDHSISEKSRVEIMSRDILVVNYLFTIDDLAYFVEVGTSSVGPGESDVDKPEDYLYLFNLKAGSWKTSEHTLPESFHSVVSFGLNNRGFSGLGTSANSPLFSYSQKFFEFTPN